MTTPDGDPTELAWNLIGKIKRSFLRLKFQFQSFSTSPVDDDDEEQQEEKEEHVGSHCCTCDDNRVKFQVD